MDRPTLIVPGWTNAGPDHWQSIWQRANPKWIRVEQSDWEYPKLEDWLTTLNEYIQQCDAPPVLVGHSLGCIAIACWGATYSAEIAGAFLVAPANVESPSAPDEIKSFAPIPTEALSFPTCIIASNDDEFLSAERALAFSSKWGNALEFIGNAGHIATASGHGEWEEGQALLRNFVSSIQA